MKEKDRLNLDEVKIVPGFNFSESELCELLETKFSDIELSVRVMGCIKKGRINTFADLLLMDRRSIIRVFGAKPTEELDVFMAGKGLVWGLDPVMRKPKHFIMESQKVASRRYFGGSPFRRIENMKLSGQDFKVSKTTGAATITSGDNTYIYSGQARGLPFWEINLQRSLRKHIREQIDLENIDMSEVITGKDVSYVRFSDQLKEMSEGECFGGCVSFDIDKAYYQAAFNLGFINGDFYKKCLEVNKKTRLRLMGSIATKKRIYNYVGGKLTSIDTVQEDDLRNVWFRIVQHIGDCMKEFSELAGDNFIMYWVDGVYLKGNADDYTDILEFIKRKWKFEFKVQDIDDIVYDYDKKLGSARLLIYDKGNKKYKPFYLTGSRGLYDKEDDQYVLEDKLAAKLAERQKKGKKGKKAGLAGVVGDGFGVYGGEFNEGGGLGVDSGPADLGDEYPPFEGGPQGDDQGGAYLGSDSDGNSDDNF